MLTHVVMIISSYLLLSRFDCIAKEVTHVEMQQFVTEHSIDILPTQNVNSARLKDLEFADGRIVIQVCVTVVCVCVVYVCVCVCVCVVYVVCVRVRACACVHVYMLHLVHFCRRLVLLWRK